MWFHSSVGRASHRYRGGHGFKSCGSPDIFQASSFHLLQLENLLRWSFFTLIYNRSTIWISYIFHFSFSAIKRIELIPCYLSGWSLSLLHSFFFYGTTQTPHYVGFFFCPLTTLVVTRNCHTSCLHKCSSFMAKNASKAYTKNNTSRKQTRQPDFTDGNDNGPWNNLFYCWGERHA